MYKKLIKITRFTLIVGLLVSIAGIYTRSQGAAINPSIQSYTCLETSPSGGDDSYSTDEATIHNVTEPGVLENDCDDYSTGAILEVSSITDTTIGLLTMSTGVGSGGFDYDPDGQFEYLANGESTPDSFTYEVTDGTTPQTHTVTITVNGLNDPPTDISLSATSIDENLPIATTVGTFTTDDVDTNDTHTYTFAAGTGDTDNGSFSIVGNALQSAEEFDFETKDSYSIRVQTDDGNGGVFEEQFTITITDANDPPTDINISASSIIENLPTGTTVGTFTTTDQDSTDTHTYSLFAGTGDDDNGSFSIVGDALQSAEAFDFETKNSYSILVQSNDGNGGLFDEQFTIAITDANDPPEVPNPIPDQNAVQSNAFNYAFPSNTFSDADSDPLTYSASKSDDTPLPDWLAFEPGTRTFSGTPGFIDSGLLSVKVTADDGNGGSISDIFDIIISGVIFTPSTDLVTTEGGAQTIVYVELATQPTDPVTVFFSSEDTTEGKIISIPFLVFPIDEWDQALQVIIAGEDDYIIDDDQPYTISTTISSSDSTYSQVNPPDLSVTNEDDDLAGITIDPTLGLITSEDGTEDEFTIELDTKPEANVKITFYSDDTSEGTVSPLSVTFTPANWDTQKTITVTGVDDDIADGDQDYTIVTNSAESLDDNYLGFNPEDVLVTNSDPDTPGYTVSPLSGLVTTEGEDSAFVNIILKTKPQEQVTFSFESSDTSEGVINTPPEPVFQPSDWNPTEPIKLQITGVDDKSVDGDIPYTVTITAVSDDPDYDELIIVDVTNKDAPTIEWVEPVITKERFTASNLMPILLRVEKDSNEQVDKVGFYYWDKVKLIEVKIGEVQESPYEIYFNPAVLYNGDNQVYAYAFGPVGPGEPFRISNLKHIWIELPYMIHMPIINK